MKTRRQALRANARPVRSERRPVAAAAPTVATTSIVQPVATRPCDGAVYRLLPNLRPEPPEPRTKALSKPKTRDS